MISKSHGKSGYNLDDCTNHVFHALGESGLLGRKKQGNVALP